MWAFTGQETVPYHLAWIGLAAAYALEPWPWRRTLTALAAYTLVTGGILVVRAAGGVIAWDETAEIPLMAILVLLVVRNVHNRHEAYAAMHDIAERDRAQAAQRERLSRMTSHEMRTPATIAIGYTDALLATESEGERREDLLVIRDELSRLVRAGDRLIRSIRAHDQVEDAELDVTGLLNDVAHRWSVLSDRAWDVSAAEVHLRCSAEQLRACLDTLIENAVRYTEPGDVVRLVARTEAQWLVVGVADSGAGMHPLMVRGINQGDVALASTPGFEVEDKLAQTGLGLAMVSEVASALGGHLRAGSADEGGAFVAMVLPLHAHRTALSPLRASLPHVHEAPVAAAVDA
jgi:two-component system OmpR family sensor kinase